MYGSWVLRFLIQAETGADGTTVLVGVLVELGGCRWELVEIKGGVQDVIPLER